MATRKPGEINPKLPVAKSEDVWNGRVIFDITKVSNFVSPQYGPTWRVFAVDNATGEHFLMLNAGNSVRDDEMAAYREATNDGDHVGPCKLDKIPRKNGQFAWNIIDADEPLTTPYPGEPDAAPAKK